MATNRKTASKTTVNKRKSSNQSVWSRLRALPKPLVVGLWVVAFGAIGTKMLFFSGATAFQYVGVHPQAILQPESSSGRELKSLAAWNGKIYAGYGDWNKNTGPVSLTPFDPATNSFAPAAEYVSDTESIDNTQVIGDKLFMLHVDPKSNNGAAYTLGNKTPGTTPWANVSKPTMTHVFGITPGFAPNELFIAGQLDEGSSTNEVAKVYRSTDGGATWVESLSVPSRGGFNRMMFISKLGDKIYAQNLSTTDFNGAGSASKAWVYSGGRWASATLISRTTQPYKGAEFAGKIILQSSPTGGALLSYDGRSSVTVLSSIRDFKIHSDGYVYALTYYEAKMAVMRSNDLVSWALVSPAPANARSLAILNNTLYIGTSDSELYKAVIDPNTKDTTPPTVAMIAPAPSAGTYTVTTKNEFAASAEDVASVQRVEFYVGTQLIGTTTSKSENIVGCAFGSCFNEPATYPGSYSLRWNGDYIPAGAYDLRAIAYDIYGNSKATTPVPIVIPVGLYPPDTEKPVVTVTAPTEGTRHRGGVYVNASATDNKAISVFEVHIDGTPVYSKQTPSVSQKFPVAKGTHTLTIRATDRAGNFTESTQSFFSR